MVRNASWPFLIGALAISGGAPVALADAVPVRTGLDVLIAQGFAPLRGKRIGLVTHRAATTADGRDAAVVLSRAPGVRLVALFAPEHGLRGAVPAGVRFGTARDRATGLPVYSLYGALRRPTPRMLQGMDALVVNLQDAGVRSYTYLSTLGLCMEAAATRNVELVVLDRPNPLGGEQMEGNSPNVLFRSFVGRYPVPYLHGMTFGELARMIQAEGWLVGRRRCRLTVIPMQGWRRHMLWHATGMRWVPTSPNVPDAETPRYLAATGIAGETSVVDVGAGTRFPFRVAGMPGLDGPAMAAHLNARGLPGVRFEPAVWTAAQGRYRGRLCAGVRLYIADGARAPLTRINFEILAAVLRVRPGVRLFLPARARMFDQVCGTDRVRRELHAGHSPEAVWSRWHTSGRAFAMQRQPYLLYS